MSSFCPVRCCSFFLDVEKKEALFDVCERASEQNGESRPRFRRKASFSFSLGFSSHRWFLRLQRDLPLQG